MPQVLQRTFRGAAWLVFMRASALNVHRMPVKFFRNQHLPSSITGPASISDGTLVQAWILERPGVFDRTKWLLRESLTGKPEASGSLWSP
jgi:hypothetical protein